MNTTNTNLTMKGAPLKVRGEALRVGSQLPKFQLTGTDMKDVTNEAYRGRALAVVVVPSLDTPVCATEARKFNEEATKLSDNVVVLVVSRDLPFAQKRYCAAEGIEKVQTLSDYKYRTFGEATGTDLPDMGLLARAVFVTDGSGKVTYVEYVPEIGQEPDYQGAIAALKQNA